MMKIKAVWLTLMMILGWTVCAAIPTITSVTAQQRYPWNGLVDIDVTISGTLNDVAQVDCSFTATNSSTGAALPITHITRTGGDTGSDTTWNRRYIWDATADVDEVKIADVTLVCEAEIPLGGVQLWENGPYWAECNVGASKPEEYGYYFWWGDTVGYMREGGTWTYGYYYSGVTWVSSDGTRMGSSPFTDSCPTYNKNTSQLQSLGYIDSTGNLVPAHDAATAYLGAPWRMPTDAEFEDLISNCTTAWITTNGVYGRLVTGKGAFSTKSIFLPAAGGGGGSGLSYPGSNGLYWSSTPYSGNLSRAWILYFRSGNFDRDYGYHRYFGQSIRPLRGFAE